MSKNFNYHIYVNEKKTKKSERKSDSVLTDDDEDSIALR